MSGNYENKPPMGSDTQLALVSQGDLLAARRSALVRRVLW